MEKGKEKTSDNHKQKIMNYFKILIEASFATSKVVLNIKYKQRCI